MENRIQTLLPLLDEKQKRIYLATEAEGLGRGGLKAIHESTVIAKLDLTHEEIHADCPSASS